MNEKLEPEEKDHWCPQPGFVCGFPSMACPNVNLPCNRCPYLEPDCSQLNQEELGQPGSGGE